MLKFESESLLNELRESISIWKNNLELEISDICEDLPDLLDPDFDPKEYGDQLIDNDKEISIWLPDVDELPKLTVRDFINISLEIKNAKLVNNVECWSDKRLLLRVNHSNELSLSYLYHAKPDDNPPFLENWTIRYLSKIHEINNKKYHISIVEGFSIFGILVAGSGFYEEYYPPVLPEEHFIEIVPLDDNYEKNHLLDIANSFIFELSACIGLDIEIEPRIDNIYFDPSEHKPSKQLNRLHPLHIGSGINELTQIYNKAISATNIEIQLLFFTQVIEYVSSTVIRKESFKRLRQKLMSSEALDPDTKFIIELEFLVNDLKVYKKDSEAVKFTIETCCDATELSKFAPPILDKLHSCKINTSKKEQAEALISFGRALYDTRNKIVHAKANYSPSGFECPDSEIESFCQCARIAAQQAIRWYHMQPEFLRVI